MKRGLARSLALVGTGALVLAACGGDDTDDGASGTSEPDGGGEVTEIATDVGVTDEPCPDAVNEDNGCIYLGIISDLTEGPFAVFGKELTAGQTDFWARVNDQGGIGGYDINVTEYTRDAKYNPQEHSQAYREIEPDVLALAQSLGTTQTQGILADMEADNVIAAPATWWSGWSFAEEDDNRVVESGASYCMQALGGLDWLAENETAPGSVLVVGFPGDFGGDPAGGAEAWAETNDAEFLGFVETGPNAAVGNQDAAVQQIVSSGADVVVLAVGPGEVAEIVGKAAAGGFTGRFLGTAPTWNPALLGTESAPALEALFYNIATHETYGSGTPAHEAMIEMRGEDNPPENDAYTFGWIWQYPLKDALEAAAANGDLTREGLFEVTDGLEVDFEGALPSVTLGGDLDRSVTINKVDPNAVLGVSTLDTGYVGPTAEAFDYSGPCFTG
jgi:ABC-type branched-subunit amino acid transport system substrate-binding protein